MLNPILLKNLIFLKGLFKDTARLNQLMGVFFLSKGRQKDRGAVFKSYLLFLNKTWLLEQCKMQQNPSPRSDVTIYLLLRKKKKKSVCLNSRGIYTFFTAWS